MISVISFIFNDTGVLTLSAGMDGSRLGLATCPLVGQSVFDSSADHSKLADYVSRALKGESISEEVSTRDRFFYNSYSPVNDGAGRIKGVIGVSIDITENKKADEFRRKNEFRHRMLFNSAHDAIFTMDNKTFVDCNEATLRIFQCTRDQIVGQTPYRFSPASQPDGRTSEESAMEKINAALNGQPQFFEWRHIRYDGTPFEAEVSLNRLDLEGEVQIQAIVRDVSERKKAEEENRRLARVANSTTNMVVIADGEGKIEWVNPAFTRITGYSFAEVLGKKPGAFLRGPESDPAVSALMGDQLKKGIGFKDIEIVNYTKDGSPYWVSIEVQPIHDSNGKVRQFVAIESDITERKATQQALISSHENLVKINAELDRFVYSASHDLRAPIASLLGLIEVARHEKDIDSLMPLFDMQRKSLQRMDRFIQDIVDYSRNSRLLVDASSVDLKKMIANSLEQLQFMQNADRIQYLVDVKQIGTFHSSTARIDIILNNLISNAIKYADFRKDSSFVKINVFADESQAEIHISDNGEGIPREAKTKIFDMFYRASQNSSGSGLGLYIVKEALEKIGGKIRVQSEYGQGAEFIVQLPCLQVP